MKAEVLTTAGEFVSGQRTRWTPRNFMNVRPISVRHTSQPANSARDAMVTSGIIIGRLQISSDGQRKGATRREYGQNLMVADRDAGNPATRANGVQTA